MAITSLFAKLQLGAASFARHGLIQTCVFVFRRADRTFPANQPYASNWTSVTFYTDTIAIYFYCEGVACSVPLAACSGVDPVSVTKTKLGSGVA